MIAVPSLARGAPSRATAPAGASMRQDEGLPLEGMTRLSAGSPQCPTPAALLARSRHAPAPRGPGRGRCPAPNTSASSSRADRGPAGAAGRPAAPVYGQGRRNSAGRSPPAPASRRASWRRRRRGRTAGPGSAARHPCRPGQRAAGRCGRGVVADAGTWCFPPSRRRRRASSRTTHGYGAWFLDGPDCGMHPGPVGTAGRRAALGPRTAACVACAASPEGKGR
jgi:hypothetical protein